MEPVEVTARFKPDGEILPQRLSWSGKVREVVSTGRQWQGDDGRHILVTLVDGLACELLWAKPDNLWYILDNKNPTCREHI